MVLNLVPVENGHNFSSAVLKENEDFNLYIETPEQFSDPNIVQGDS